MREEMKKDSLDYEKLIQTEEFKNLVKRKQNFSRPFVIFFFIVFFTLPILTGYTTILENRAIGWMTWTWVYSFSIFLMVWVLTSIYMSKAKNFDDDVDEIMKKYIVK